jgi:hypothetical protein
MVPSVSIRHFVRRLMKAIGTPEPVLVAAILMDRMSSAVAPCGGNVYRLYAACFVLAAKLTDDRRLGSRWFSHVTGIPPREINALESAALNALHFSLHVAVEQWLAYAEPLAAVLTALA